MTRSALLIEHRTPWLRPPAPTIRLDRALVTKTRRALTTLLRDAENADPTRARRSMLAEADASSLIEGVDADPTDPGSFTGALAEAMHDADGTTQADEVLRWHAQLMRDHKLPEYISPGQYRRVNVRVGDWLAPPHQEVAARMAEFHQWLDDEPDPLMRAVWGHRYFETIHPFADGNGRTGRMLIRATLASPVCISRTLWWERREYMALLAEGSWRQWSNWMLTKLQEEAYRTARDLRDGPTHDSDARVVRWLTQRPLPKNYDDMSVADLMITEALLRNRVVQEGEKGR